jgi:hypothetical protein
MASEDAGRHAAGKGPEAEAHVTETCPTCHRPLDVVKRCRDCGRPFSVSLSEQRYFESKGLQPPKRCTDCRRDRRANQTKARGARTAPR